MKMTGQEADAEYRPEHENRTGAAFFSTLLGNSACLPAIPFVDRIAINMVSLLSSPVVPGRVSEMQAIADALRQERSGD